MVCVTASKLDGWLVQSRKGAFGRLFFMRDANAMRAARKPKSEACACILALAWRPLPIRRRSRGPAIVRRPRRIRRSVVVRP
ncbi:hypothetical protein FE789_27375 [Burkholderia pseudomallei]|nr:hypothetical protein FE789_27375 [Burkholderia pseudomallei]